jgi:hypothetical protein
VVRAQHAQDPCHDHERSHDEYNQQILQQCDAGHTLSRAMTINDFPPQIWEVPMLHEANVVWVVLAAALGVLLLVATPLLLLLPW